MTPKEKAINIALKKQKKQIKEKLNSTIIKHKGENLYLKDFNLLK